MTSLAKFKRDIKTALNLASELQDKNTAKRPLKLSSYAIIVAKSTMLLEGFKGCK